MRAGGGAQPVGYVGCIAVSQGRKSAGFSPGKADQVWHPSSSKQYIAAAAFSEESTYSSV